ncbi:MAG: hypothetical protein JRI23_15480 [Deltaproteobacteria bacterium]|jgi:hypothetical protein|nr:hypothetical protein [Deltaproteobacteria bacterium]MBW2533154.1 hypothetical protein [Deltaproteobacteria bacterium]
MATVIDDLLACCWPEGIPPRLDQLVDRPLAERLLGSFKLEPVFPLENGTRPIRLFVSAEQERERWSRQVGRLWPSDGLDEFLQQGPAPTRWMVDSDGSDHATLFLDDLHRTSSESTDSQGLTLMCLTLELPTGAEQRLTRHEQPPLPRLTGSMERGLRSLLDHGAAGMFALRWSEDEVVAVAWISETRWRRNPASARRAVRALGAHRVYDRALETLARHERIGYPDVVEIFRDGRIDLTMGVL